MQKPPTYFRYVDDTFAIFDHKAKADELVSKLNCLHPSLIFTFEKDKTNVYHFLMSMSKEQILILKSVYPKIHFHKLVFTLRIGRKLILFANLNITIAR